MDSVPPPNWQPSSTPAPKPPAPAASVWRVRPLGALAVVGVAMLAGVAFLLFGSSSSKLADPVAQAATVSSSAAGYRLHILVSVPSLASGTMITGVGDGTVDTRDHAASMTVSIHASAGNVLRINDLVDGTSVYMKLPPAVAGALGSPDKPWVKLGLAKALHLPGVASIGTSPMTSDPSQALRYLRDVSTGIASEGQERVDGVQTTHYRAALSLERVASAIAANDRAAAQQAIAGLQQATQSPTIPVDVWVDAGHLVRRLSMIIDTALGGQPIGVSVTMDYSDYGPQPRPVLPPADQVRDISTLTSSLGGQ